MLSKWRFPLEKPRAGIARIHVENSPDPSGSWLAELDFLTRWCQMRKVLRILRQEFSEGSPGGRLTLDVEHRVGSRIYDFDHKLAHAADPQIWRRGWRWRLRQGGYENAAPVTMTAIKVFMPFC